MNRMTNKRVRRARRKQGIRKEIFGMPDRPRLSVFRSLNHVYAQVIDDLTGKTLVSASTRDKGFAADGGKSAEATAVGAKDTQHCTARCPRRGWPRKADGDGRKDGVGDDDV